MANGVAELPRPQLNLIAMTPDGQPVRTNKGRPIGEWGALLRQSLSACNQVVLQASVHGMPLQVA
jgi:hypothetical protein